MGKTMKTIHIAAILTILAVGFSSVSTLSSSHAENNQQTGMGSLISLAKSVDYKDQSKDDKTQEDGHEDQ